VSALQGVCKMKKIQTFLYVVIMAFFVWGCASSPRHNSLSDVAEKDAIALGFSSEDSNDPMQSTTSSGDNTRRFQSNDHSKLPLTMLGSDVSATFSAPGSRPSTVSSETSKKTAAKKQSGTFVATSQKKKVRAFLDEALEYCQVSKEFWQKGELENALEALDHAYSLILEVDTEDNLKLFQEKEDLRFAISKRILEIYGSRYIVVSGQHSEIPMVLNKHVQTEIDLLTGNERQFFIDSYRRSGLFRPHILGELRKNGLPESLSWLPLIESGFKVHALSKARALGLWQFIASTGYRFGLNRDYYIDERLNPIKATSAAISYLKELHQLFGDWTTVLAAYNCGEGRVLREISTQNINYLDNFWDLYEKLPRETARYVPRFFAVLHILKDPAKYGFEDLPIDPAIDFETVQVNREVHLETIATAIGVPEEDLKNLNPELRYSILPNDTYTLLIPSGSKDQLLAEIDNLPLASLPKLAFDETPRTAAYVTHRVRQGETLSNIAASYGTSTERIREANDLGNGRIVSGKKLKIPLKGAIPAVCETPSLAKAKEQSTAYHTVKQGDSLWNIARQYCTTAQKIKALNNLESYSLQNGQVIKIYEPTVKPPQKEMKKNLAKNEQIAKPQQKDAKAGVVKIEQTQKPQQKDVKKYVVKKGDTVYTIAKRTNMSLEEFLNINRITPRSKIFPGQELHVD
jgi:membrane-bound lytic murein transglycosylase D